MIELEPPFRYATPDDAEALAELINFAGEGLPLYLWTSMAGPGESAWEVGRRRALREVGSFSYRNAVIAEAGGRIVASLIGYLRRTRPTRSTTTKCRPSSCPSRNSRTWRRAPGT
jgi:hypothetical protein